MGTKITKEKTGISLSRFKKEAKRWYPEESKTFYMGGKKRAKYSGKTKKVKLL